MVKSMLDLRQLETFAHKKTPNFPPHDRERQSTSSLQEPMVCMDLCLRDRKRDLSCMNPCVYNCSAMSPIIFCSCSWRREPRGIGPGRTLTGCPRTRPRASGGLMELCFTLKRMRAIWVYRAGKPHALCSWFHSSDHNDTEREQKCFSILGSMFPSSPVPHCFCLSLSLCFSVRQWLHGEGTALQDARARDPQWEPGEPQRGQCLLSGLRQQGVKPGSCPGWWGLTVMTTSKI